MPYRKIFFDTNKTFHIISRAVDERKIFEDEDDCWRFVFQIFAANVGKPRSNLWRKDVVKAAKDLLLGNDISSGLVVVEHDPLISILDFSLVMTHYHFYILPNIEEGVAIFMQRLNVGFAKYFNFKHQRKGALFGSRYKSIPVETDFQSDAVSRYINIVNPLDVFQPGWRKEGLNDKTKAVEFLKNYPFSSFPDKIGIRKSKILADKEVIKNYCLDSMVTEEKYMQFVDDFLNEKLSLNNLLSE